MAEDNVQTAGHIGWVDLTVPNADEVRDFYTRVTGWTPAPVAMGDYQDYCMNAPDGRTVAGICHARGENAALPPVWLVYITVPDLEESLRRCLEGGGKVRLAPQSMGEMGRFAVIEDPVGAVAGLFEPQGARE